MNITLYNNTSEKNRLKKSLIKLSEYKDCSIITPMSIIDPVVMINDVSMNFNANYLYIPEFNRYYFIKNITSVNNGCWELSCHIDVLSTYAEQVKQLSAIFKRQESNFNLYLNDDKMKEYATETVITRYFNSDVQFDTNSNNFVLTVVNNGGGVQE